MSADLTHGSELTSTGFSMPGPKKDDGFTIAGGPTAPGSYRESPKRVTVRMADPHVEAPMIPRQVVHHHNSRPGASDLTGAECGSGRQR